MPVRVGSGGGAYGQAGGGGGNKRSLREYESLSDSDSPPFARRKYVGTAKNSRDGAYFQQRKFFDYEVVICGTQLTAAAFPELRPESIKGGGDPLIWGDF